MNNSLTLTIEDEQLTRELKQLNTEFLELFICHKDMVDHESVILTSLYLEKLGGLQLELLHKQTMAANFKMKMQLIQAAINRDQKPDIKAIEQEIEERLKVYYSKIEAQSAALDKANEVLASLLSEEDSRKLKETFRVLCKKLHPDLNPKQSEEDKDLFIKVKAAYDLQRIDELQKILLFINGSGNKDLSLITGNEKKNRIEHLKKNIDLLKNKISQLKENFPFSIRELIEDPELILKNQEDLRTQIQTFEEKIDEYQSYIAIMINE